MNTFEILASQLGPLTLPLLAMGLSAIVIGLESIVQTLYYCMQSNKKDLELLYAANSHLDTKLLDDVVELFLAERIQKQSGRVKLLNLIAAIAPITGLLGTILGLISAFEAVAKSTSGVNPTLIADGLGLAMYTTAAGLAIALPCILITHGVTFISENNIQSLASKHNLKSLSSRSDADLGAFA